MSKNLKGHPGGTILSLIVPPPAHLILTLHNYRDIGCEPAVFAPNIFWMPRALSHEDHHTACAESPILPSLANGKVAP